VAARSKAWVCGHFYWHCGFESPLGVWMSTSVRVLLGRRLCDGPITRWEEFYRVWYVSVWSWNLNNEKVWVHYGLSTKKNANAEETNYAITGELWSLAIVSGINTRVLFCTQWRLFVWRQLANLSSSISEQQRRHCKCEKSYRECVSVT
jgi:hypothetical protein